jgi:hypothetical protein
MTDEEWEYDFMMAVDSVTRVLRPDDSQGKESVTKNQAVSKHPVSLFDLLPFSSSSLLLFPDLGMALRSR